jgi:RNA ligase (TIGR02306 family)
MSSFAVTAERLIVHPHPDPAVERIELAQVGEYRAVVPRGRYRTGDWAIYIPEQALVPEALLQEMGLSGKLAGPAKNRVKAMRFRGELSQGLVCSPGALSGVDLAAAGASRVNFAAQLGIQKWVPEIPAALAGQMIAAPELMSWIEIENIKRFPQIFAHGEPVIANEKIHGSATCVTWVRQSAQLLVSSKGFASKKLAIVEAQNNLYWRALRAFGVESLLREAAGSTDAPRIGLYGEVYGPGVQDLHYGRERKDTPGFAVFDLALDTEQGRTWLPQARVRELCAAHGIEVPPVLYEGGYDYAALAVLAEGRTRLGGDAHVREGLVVRAVPERSSEILGGRAIAKFVGEGYLTRSGGSEFE